MALHNLKKVMRGVSIVKNVNSLGTSIADNTCLKRVYCLYRVSTKKQFDSIKDDIPMQKIACHEFLDTHTDWVIEKEFYEKGVSGFKVSAENRDAIQDLKEAAIKHEFDILLVYMFDRLGRIENETPFVLEWFVKQGIEVWSTREGQQKFEDHVDKLTNYIRFWQASGESTKTSMRLKTVMAQMTAEGIYRGGPTPLGYVAVNNGRTNKKGQPVKDLEINPVEAEYVRMIFEKTANEGYGSYRMAEYLNQLNIKTHNGSEFQCNTINRILKNRIYCGYYVSGETISPKIESLVIVDENLFDTVQYILKQRSAKNDEKCHIARTTKSKALLSGNIFCGHCGSNLVANGNVEKYERKDGTVGESHYMRYVCYHRTRRLNDCDGQSIYSASKVEKEVLNVVKSYLRKIKSTPKDKALEIRYRKELKEKKQLKRKLDEEKEKLQRRLSELAIEVGKSLNGENTFPVDVLTMSINSTKTELNAIEQKIRMCDSDVGERNKVLDKLDYYYQQFVTWADEFENASHEKKKMIICQLIKSIEIRKGYDIKIELNMSYKQFFAD